MKHSVWSICKGNFWLSELMDVHSIIMDHCLSKEPPWSWILKSGRISHCVDRSRVFGIRFSYIFTGSEFWNWSIMNEWTSINSLGGLWNIILHQNSWRAFDNMEEILCISSRCCGANLKLKIDLLGCLLDCTSRQVEKVLVPLCVCNTSWLLVIWKLWQCIKDCLEAPLAIC